LSCPGVDARSGYATLPDMVRATGFSTNPDPVENHSWGDIRYGRPVDDMEPHPLSCHRSSGTGSPGPIWFHEWELCTVCGIADRPEFPAGPHEGLPFFDADRGLFSEERLGWEPLRQDHHDWQQTCQCGEAVYCPDCQAAWVVGHGPEPAHVYRGPRSPHGDN
jgi:hypothetical protein